MRRPPVDPLVGRTVGGRYRLIQRLGTGGMSSVYLARHVLIDRLMAIKMLRRDLASDPIQRDRFVREARAVNRINHENIVEITDYGETDDGLLYLVMEYVPGESLLKVMGEGPFPALRAFDIVEQAGAALARAHQMGVIHRDLKPENMILVQRAKRRDFLKILDFGIAKLLDQPSLTGSQQIFGTPGYIAPEYIQSTAIDGRADLYSLGVILYEMVTGALPFDYEYPGDLLIKHVTEEPIPPTERRPGIEPTVEAFVLRCLAKTPDKRFRDAFHFLEELRATRERLGTSSDLGTLDAAGEASASGASSGRTTPTTQRLTADEQHTEALGIEIPVIVTGAVSTESQPARRTAEYGRRSIPVAPRDDLSIEIEIEEPVATIAARESGARGDTATTHQGTVGATRWRERFDALRACLDELEEKFAPPTEIDQAMALAARLLDDLEDSVRAASREQQALEDVTARARELRTSLGCALDELAGQLSHASGEVVDLEERSLALELRRGDLAEEGRTSEVDAVVWEHAAIAETLRHKRAQHAELEARVRELRTKLERENESLEREIAALGLSLDREMKRLWPMSTGLRDPLTKVERYVRSRWAE